MVPDADTWREKGNQKQLKTGEYNSICKGSPVSHCRGFFLTSRIASDQSLQDFAGIEPERDALGCPQLEGACVSTRSVKYNSQTKSL